jgi:ABC-type glycerol-3-phosphate transport system substrate-binding protein
MISSTNNYDVIIVDCYWTGEFVDAGWLLRWTTT